MPLRKFLLLLFATLMIGYPEILSQSAAPTEDRNPPRFRADVDQVVL